MLILSYFENSSVHHNNLENIFLSSHLFPSALRTKQLSSITESHINESIFLPVQIPLANWSDLWTKPGLNALVNL